MPQLLGYIFHTYISLCRKREKWRERGDGAGVGTEGLVQPAFRPATLGLGRWVGEPRSKEAAGGASGVTPSL